jgi:hypothetical protein
MRLSRVLCREWCKGCWGPRRLTETPEQAPVATRAARSDLAPNYWVAHAGLPECGWGPPRDRTGATIVPFLAQLPLSPNIEVT